MSSCVLQYTHINTVNLPLDIIALVTVLLYITVLAMLCSLDIATWFVTLSAADLHWPEMIQAVALQLGRRPSKDDVLKMSIAEKSTYLQQNPITGVCMFQHRLQSFFSQHLMNDAHPLGHIPDYVIKIEFQDSGDDVCRFIEKYITAMVPKGVLENESDANLMKSLQKHTHSDYWHRNKSCCYRFPKPTASRTVISCQPSEEDKANDMIKYAKDVLQKVQNVLSSIEIANEDLAIADLSQNIGIDLDTHMQALNISQKGHRIILQ